MYVIGSSSTDLLALFVCPGVTGGFGIADVVVLASVVGTATKSDSVPSLL